MASVLVIGGGGREHAMVFGLAKSSDVRKVYCSPGNPGIAAENKVECVTLDIKQHQNVLDFCRTKDVKLVAVGPEAPLADGITDTLTEAGLRVFGPSHAAAALEYDKVLAKDFMRRHGIPTARSQSFRDKQAAKTFIQESGWGGWAIKAAGLAGGKGVVVTSVAKEAQDAVGELTEAYKSAASTLLVEERLHGQEISAMCFSDGTDFSMMPPAQDHKPRYAGNTGPNTGGMGAVCPYPVAAHTTAACRQILQDTIDGMRKEGTPFKGVLYAGLMVCEGKPFVLEYNCRFGDPEIQAVLQLLRSDLYTVMEACATGRLAQQKAVVFSTELFSCAVVVVTGSYPAGADKGLPIKGLETVSSTEGCEVKVYHSSTAQGSEGGLVTNGGRVVSVVATGASATDAREVALQKAKSITFTGAAIREDIGLQALKILQSQSASSGQHSYTDAGVDVALGERFVENIRASVASTQGPRVLEGLGGFGALYDLHALGMKEPVLVSGTDGVGTKLMVANAVGCHDTIGQDLVAMCVNDILCHGARPLFFLDYLATGKLELSTMEAVVRGIAAACKKTDTALVGGETAEMPGLYRPGEYDVAGFAVGAVEKEHLLPKRSKMADGDVVIGLSSSGFHSNGYSLVRKIVDGLKLKYTDPCPYDSSKTIGGVLLTPTRLYSPLFLKVESIVLGASHITGGGISGNAARMLPSSLAVHLDITKWNIPEEFIWIASQGVSPEEMAKTFNLGLGLLLVVQQQHQQQVLAALGGDGASVVGQLKTCTQDEPRVVIHGLETHVTSQVEQFVQRHKQQQQQQQQRSRRVRTAILISGRGSNMEAIVRASQEPDSPAEVVLVLSNKPDAAGLSWAAQRNILTKCVNHREFSDRPSFESVVQQRLQEQEVELVVLAGFMRVLTEGFVSQWKDRLINIHPSILPSFKGKDAQKQALEAKVKITGCSVHFVEAEVDSGAILAQASVPVLADDTVDSLSARILQEEHQIFPSAVMDVASSMLERS